MAKGSFLNQVRLTLLKWMEVIGTSAFNLASNAKLKAAEINLENRRREILTNFSLRAFELWQKGVELPASLSEMLVELSEIEDKLSVLRAQKYARVCTPDIKPEPAQASDSEPEPAVPVPCTVGDETGGHEEAARCELEDVEPEPEASAPAEEPVPAEPAPDEKA